LRGQRQSDKPQASLTVAILLVLCIRPLRRRWYELFLRTHQILAGIILYTVWAHTRGSDKSVARYGSIAIAAIFGLVSIGHLLHILVLNRMFYRGLPRARIAVSSNVVRLTVDIPTALRLFPGQYINIYMPGVSFWSFLQSHPFVVASAQLCGNRTTLELVVEARHGWTSKLLLRSRDHDHADDWQSRTKRSYLCLFSGPHGRRESVDDYDAVVLVASGWGLTGLLPYLQHLIRGYNTLTTRARCIHLIWQLHAAGES